MMGLRRNRIPDQLTLIAEVVAWKQAIIISCLDNLIKGTAVVAVQNFNLMCGYSETTVLL